MPQIMDTHLKALSRQLIAQLLRDAVFAFRHEIKRRTKAPLRIHLHQLAATFQPSLVLDIMSQDEGKFFPVRPAGPAWRRTLRTWHNRPNRADLCALASGKPTADGAPNIKRHQGFDAEIDFVAKHWWAVGNKRVKIVSTTRP